MRRIRIVPVLAALVLLAVAAVLSWPRTQPAPTATMLPAAQDADVRHVACALPPPVARDAAPLQTAVPPGFGEVALADAQLRPLAGFSVQARVLGTREYASGREARYAPLDLALGWGRMREGPVLARLDIGQSGRWYRYRWSGPPPLPPQEIAASSANMHMIPGDARIAADLALLRAGHEVRIDGWLVDVDAADGWRWRSSIRRDDTGQGACEIVYVCAVTLLATR